MATRSISATIALNGEQAFNSAMKNINSNLRVLKSELSATSSSFSGQANSLAALTAKNKQLSEIYAQQKEKVRALEQAVKESSEKYGENSQQTDRLKVSYNQARVELDKLGQELQQNAQYMEEAKNSTDQCATSIDQYGNRVKDASDKSKGFGNTGQSSFLKVGKALIAAGIAAKVADIAKKLASATKEAAAFADEVLTLSAKTNISTDALQGYMYAAELVDVSVETITKSMQRNIRSMGSAADGTAQYANAYKQLGVAVQDSNGDLRDSQEVFWELIDALGQMTNETERDEIAMTLLGKSAQDLNPLIEAGADRMRELADEAASVGYIMSAETLSALGSLDDQLQRLDGAATAAKNALGAALAPTLENLAEKATNALVAITNTINYLSAYSAKQKGDVKILDTNNLEEARAKVEELRAELALLGGERPRIDLTQDELLSYNTLNIMLEQEIREMEALETAAGEAADAIPEPAEQMAEKFDTIMATFDEKAKMLMQTYEDTYNAAYESMSGQFDLFEMAATEVSLSTDQMIEAMMSQVDYMSTYSENLRLAAKYGITDGLVAALSDGSTQSAGYLQAIVAEIEAAGGAASEGGQKIVRGLNAAFNAQQQSLEAYATSSADTNTQIDEKMSELVENTAQKVAELDMADDAQTSAANTITGFLAGIDANSGALLARMTKLGQGAIAAFNAGLEENSPSRATKRSAYYAVTGFTDEIKDKEEFVKRTMQELGKTAADSFSVDLSASGGPAGGERGSSISSSTVINIYPQQMDEATIDYIYDRFNAKAGAAVT